MSFLFRGEPQGPMSTNRTVAYDFDWRQPLLLLYLGYTIPSFIAYYKCRQFLKKSVVQSNYFTVIFTNDFFINVALFIIDLLLTRLPISGLLVDLPVYLPRGIHLVVLFFLSYYLIYANYFSVTLICLNRMSSVVFPYSCTAFWQKYVNIAIALIYILPLITTWQIITYDPYFLPLYNNRSNYQLVYEFKSMFGGWLLRNSSALCIVSVFLSIVCVLANVATIFKYKKTVQIMKAGNQNLFIQRRTKRIELAMVAIAFVVCLSLVLQAVLQGIIMLNTPYRALCQDMRAFALDFSICCPPWILYYTTVHSSKTSISTSSMHHSGAKY